jgi:hypothetical protein
MRHLHVTAGNNAVSSDRDTKALVSLSAGNGLGVPEAVVLTGHMTAAAIGCCTTLWQGSQQHITLQIQLLSCTKHPSIS